MQKDYFISIFLDCRREKQNGKFPVKLRVFTSMPRKQKLYPTSFEFSKCEFESIWETVKPRNEYKNTRLALQAVESKANQVAETIKPFSFEQFEKKLFRHLGDNDNILYHYAQIITELRENEKFGTAGNYDLSQKSFIGFIKHLKGSEPKKISFYEITPDWLMKYEKYMVVTLGRSKTTVSMYSRTLRTVFNKAIKDKEIDPEIYPFGRDKYKIPATKNIKKPLNIEQMKALFHTEPVTPNQMKAKAFWFFSYSCNGMNFKDISQLKYKNLSGDTLKFVRAKTEHNEAQQEIVVYLNEFTKCVMEEYGNKDKSPESYVFPFINRSLSGEDQHRQLKNFIRYVNQHFDKFAKSVGIESKVSTYWARHTFATRAIQKGATMEFVGEALGHSDMKTTQNYFAGFEDEKKKEIGLKLMEF